MAPLTYLNTCPALPANAPLGFPHLIDASCFHEETDKKDLRAADTIATLLWNWKPEAFHAFMDLNRAKFELSQSQPYMNKLIVARLGQGIMFGYLDDELSWETQMLYTLSVTGEWIPNWGQMNGYTSDKPEIIEGFALEFAKSILYWKKWEEGEDVKTKAEWTKLPSEEGYNDFHKASHDLYGMPEGWKNMTDEEIENFGTAE